MSNLPQNAPRPNVPAHVQSLYAQLYGQSSLATREFSAGVQSSIAILSIRGSKWRERIGGQETMILLDDGVTPVASLDLVLVAGSPSISKSFYGQAYVEGNDDAPACMSLHGDKPEPGCKAPQSPTCAVCPQNMWGSRMTPDGRRAKACSDRRRIAVCFAEDLADPERSVDDITLYLLNVPPMSLINLKNYDASLHSVQTPAQAVVTRVSFDQQKAAPTLLFAARSYLNEEQLQKVLILRERELAEGTIINTAVEVDPKVAGAATAEAPEAQPVAQPVQQVVQPVAQPVAQPVQQVVQPVQQAAPAQPQASAGTRRRRGAAAAGGEAPPVAQPMQQPVQQVVQPNGPVPNMTAAPADNALSGLLSQVQGIVG